MKKLIILSLLIAVLYGLVRSYLLAPDPIPNQMSLENLPKHEKIKALDELKVIYHKQNPVKAVEKKHTQSPKQFYSGSKEEFESMEKVRLIDERGNPVNLEEEGQNGTDEERP